MSEILLSIQAVPNSTAKPLVLPAELYESLSVF